MPLEAVVQAILDEGRAESEKILAEARVERLCRAFEEEKRYLVQRWRWPELFAP